MFRNWLSWILSLCCLTHSIGMAAETLVVDLGEGVSVELVRVSKGQFSQGSPESEQGHEADNEIDRRVHLLKVHAPYQESDHVMAHVLNMLCGGTRLEHLELLRNNEALLNAVGADSIPDPTTAGDFCRRFMADDLDSLTSAIQSRR